jgi:HD-GYP domain-containing protein (c-di-GMP phosphodiesterase class II)
MIDKNKDKRFTQINESLVAARKIQIVKLENESIKIEKDLKNGEQKLQEVINNIKKQRILSSTRDDFKYQIICYCENVYHTNNDPYAKLKVDRPSCRNCRERLE